MKTNPARPIAKLTHARIDIFFGGNEDESFTASLELARQSRMALESENIIYLLNTLMPKAKFDTGCAALAAAHRMERRTMMCHTVNGDALMGELRDIETDLTVNKAKLLILNSFDWAVYDSRQRMRFIHWLKYLRDTMNVSVAIFMQHAPLRTGSTARLAFIAASIKQIDIQEASEPVDLQSFDADDEDLNVFSYDEVTESDASPQAEDELLEQQLILDDERESEAWAQRMANGLRNGLAKARECDAMSAGSSAIDANGSLKNNDLGDVKVTHAHAGKPFDPLNEPINCHESLPTNSSSSSTATPKLTALSSFEPASVPATT